jgi:hypothetical protein
MINFTCVIDTCSFVNLTLFEFNRGTLLDLLKEKANIKLSSEVHRIEIPNHENDLMPSKDHRVNFVHKMAKYSYPEYERRLFGGNEPREKGDKGEKDNLSVALDMFITKRTKGIVYLTDDYTALRKCLSPQIYSFPLYQIWNSFDVILYLYIDHKIFTKELAIAALRKLNGILSVDDPKMRKSKAEQVQQRLSCYLLKIETISKVLNR